MDYESLLIALYAAHDVGEVRNKPSVIEQAFGMSVDELSRDPQFPPLKEYIETQKRYIEDHREKLSVPRAQIQVGECLRVLLRLALFPDAVRAVFERRMETLKKLLIAMYGDKWSQGQRDHFTYMVANLITWKSYFLSYTNRGARASNERYKKVIRRAPAKLWKGRNWDEDNILADVIVNSLFIRNLQRSFYDKKDIGGGQNLMLKIGPAIDNVFAFIQLVQTETFTEADDNYCYIEWDLFHRSSAQKLVGRDYFCNIFEDRFAAILADKKEFLFPDPIPESYDKWREVIFKETRHTTLPTDPEEFETTMLALKARIVSLQDDILVTVPA